MKNFSLKALGATLLTAGLVVAGVAGPANAVASTISTSVFTSGNGAAAVTFVAGTNPSAAIDQLDIKIMSSSLASWFRFPSACNTTGETWSDCGIDSVSLGGTSLTGSTSGATADYVNQGSGNGSIRLHFPSTATGQLQVVFAANGIFAPDVNGTYAVTVDALSGGAAKGSNTVDVTVSGARSTVLFYKNLSSSDYTFTQQLASVQTALTSNTWTRTGYTFSGWSTTRTGTVAYADGAQFSFTSPNSSSTPPTMLYAIWTADSGSGSGSGSSSSVATALTMGAATGGVVAGSSVAITASGLQTTAAYTVVVQSTPQTIGSGNAVAGAVNASVTLPSGLEAGWHTLTFTSTAADGSAVESKVYFKVSSTGTLLSSTTTIPAELASTGLNVAPYLSTGAVLALAGVVLMLFARRRQTS